MLLRCAAQHPVNARLRGEVHAAVRQARHDLAGRQAGELGAIGHLQNLLPLGLTELVARRCPLIRGPAIGPHLIAVTHPALERAQAQAQFFAGFLQPAT
jgi:hypothetical protein